MQIFWHSVTNALQLQTRIAPRRVSLLKTMAKFNDGNWACNKGLDVGVFVSRIYFLDTSQLTGQI